MARSEVSFDMPEEIVIWMGVSDDRSFG